jgi:hypothetical protein
MWLLVWKFISLYSQLTVTDLILQNIYEELVEAASTKRGNKECSNTSSNIRNTELQMTETETLPRLISTDEQM